MNVMNVCVGGEEKQDLPARLHFVQTRLPHLLRQATFDHFLLATIEKHSMPNVIVRTWEFKIAEITSENTWPAKTNDQTP